jgi:hypothetical protein
LGSEIPFLPHSPSVGDLERFDAAVDETRFAWAVKRCPAVEDVMTIVETSGLVVDCEPVPADVIVSARYVARAVLDPSQDRANYDTHFKTVRLWNSRQGRDSVFEADEVPDVFRDLMSGGRNLADVPLD